MDIAICSYLGVQYSTTCMRAYHLAVCMLRKIPNIVLCSLTYADLLVGCVEGDVGIVVEGVEVGEGIVEVAVRMEGYGENDLHSAYCV